MKNDLLNVPIDTRRDRDTAADCYLGGGAEKNTVLLPTNGVNLNSEMFVAFLETMRAIVEGTVWNKKARIVLEYDPDAEKMPITVFMERDEALKKEVYKQTPD